MYGIEKTYMRYMEEIGGKIIASKNPCEAIRKTRVGLRITQEELGKLVSLRRETISRIENGVINPTSDFIRRFAKIIAIAKIIRDMDAFGEVSRMEGRAISPLTPNLLRLYLNVSLDDLRLISEIGVRGYQKTRAKILRSSILKEV